MPDTRRLLYDRIIAVMQEGAEAYYREHPERAGDSRSDDAVRFSHDGLERIFAILNEYDIRPKPKSADA